jgi:uncharacterized lipoprotein YddW (UPF0748 family)
MKKFSIFILIFVLISGNISSKNHKREMRAVWIATVANIDWPSSSKINPFQQQVEMIQMLDKLAENNINTIVFQARPTADAFYYSSMEPWSRYLNGRQGLRPNPFYDPLEFIIREAHNRFMEVHVWLNPYRVLNGESISALDKEHQYFKNKELFVQYGGKYYFNPGLDETRLFLNNVVKDIVERYDIDAIHFDDYFYPYPVNGEEFPDSETFKKFPRSFTNKADWRRNNVDMVISELQQTIRNAKPWVEFGISPFGVWRNNNIDPMGSATRAGIQNYDDLYADILKWLREGTIDYVVPQLYWEIGKKVADYEILVDWWSKNSYNKNLYIGLYASALESKQEAAWRKPNELARQLRMNELYPEVTGAFYFSAKTFVKNLQGLNDSLKSTFYKYPAICPLNANLQDQPKAIQPENIRIIQDKMQTLLMWDPVLSDKGNEVFYYVVYAFKGKKIGDMNNPAAILTFTKQNYIDLKKHLRELKGNYSFVVTSVNRYSIESTPGFGITKKI